MTSMVKNWFLRHPLQNLHANIDKDIAQHGRSIVCVGGCGEGFSFAYTVGNYYAGLPELLVIGTCDGGFLNDLSQQQLGRGKAFLDGQLVGITDGRLPMKAVVANKKAREEYTIQAGQHFGTEDYGLMQLLISDRNGWFPDEPACAQPYSRVPVLRELVRLD